MLTKPQIHLAGIFIKIFYRDRQAIFFSLLFPLIFTGIFLFSNGEPDPLKLGLVNEANNELSIELVEMVKQEKFFLVKEGSADQLTAELIAGDQTAIIIIPRTVATINEIKILFIVKSPMIIKQSNVIN